MLLEGPRWRPNVSVPLVFEFEEAAKRECARGDLTDARIDAILDYLCAKASRREIFYLWRPFLRDPDDDLVLELAVESRCDFIITFNTRNFAGAERFGIRVVTPREFLKELREVS